VGNQVERKEGGMDDYDPLEQTQENLHPVIVAARARDRVPSAPARVRPAALIALLCGGGLLFAWLVLPQLG
jgi:hypothetical protein